MEDKTGFVLPAKRKPFLCLLASLALFLALSGCVGDQSDIDISFVCDEESQNITDLVFNPLKEALITIPTVEAEPGNPGNLSEEEISDIQKTLLSTTLGLTELYTGVIIENNKNLYHQNQKEVISIFSTAQMISEKDPDKALDLYSKAFCGALMVNSTGTPTSDSTQVPFQVHVTPSFMSTKVNRKPIFLVGVLGSRDQYFLRTLKGDVNKMKWDFLDPIEMNLGSNNTIYITRVKIDLSNVDSGTYNIQIDAVSGSEVATGEFILLVNPNKREVIP